ncbi:MAG: hypothetical protein HYR89_01500 [Actinobacteria bacterium]|nr:hypothetical protein [Actinomycetota bacterium]
MSDPATPTAIESTREVDWSEFRSLWGDGSQGRDLTRVRSLGITIAIACWVVALVLIALTWNQVAELSSVADQIPWLVSGGITAIVLAIVGGGVLVGGLLASMAPRSRAKD